MTARVCIVGAGPVGVVAAIACARKGMRVTLFEAERQIDRSPRAATTHPSTLEMLAELGLLEEFQSLGLVARYFQFWDGATKTLVAEFDHEVLRGETPYPYVVQIAQLHLRSRGMDQSLQGHGRRPEGALARRVSRPGERDGRRGLL